MKAGLRTILRVSLGAGVGALLALCALAWWVLESSGVATTETRTAQGETRSTHVWFVTRDGQQWLEAGTSQNGWYRDIVQSPVVTITIADDRSVQRAIPVLDRSVQREIRELLRAKYGVRDEIVGWFVDSSGSIAVRLLAAAVREEGL